MGFDCIWNFLAANLMETDSNNPSYIRVVAMRTALGGQKEVYIHIHERQMAQNDLYFWKTLTYQRSRTTPFFSTRFSWWSNPGTLSFVCDSNLSFLSWWLDTKTTQPYGPTLESLVAGFGPSVLISLPHTWGHCFSSRFPMELWCCIL